MNVVIAMPGDETLSMRPCDGIALTVYTSWTGVFSASLAARRVLFRRAVLPSDRVSPRLVPITGAVLMGVTLIDAVVTCVLKAVEPPLPETLTPVCPLVPEDWSQARNVIAPADPLKLVVGMNRTWDAVSSNVALVFVTPVRLNHVVPLTEYCQVPCVVSTAMTAIPWTAPESTSVMSVPPAEARIAATVLPGGFVLFSRTLVRVSGPTAVLRTGASLTPCTMIVAVAWAVFPKASLTV